MSAESVTDAAAPSPLTMVTGSPTAMVCEGDVCYIPGFGTPDAAASAASDSNVTPDR